MMVSSRARGHRLCTGREDGAVLLIPSLFFLVCMLGLAGFLLWFQGHRDAVESVDRLTQQAALAAVAQIETGEQTLQYDFLEYTYPTMPYEYTQTVSYPCTNWRWNGWFYSCTSHDYSSPMYGPRIKKPAPSGFFDNGSAYQSYVKDPAPSGYFDNGARYQSVAPNAFSELSSAVYIDEDAAQVAAVNYYLTQRGLATDTWRQRVLDTSEVPTVEVECTLSELDLFAGSPTDRCLGVSVRVVDRYSGGFFSRWLSRPSISSVGYAEVRSNTARGWA